MKNLKLLVVIAVFASFFACEQQEFETPQTVAETNIVKPDVYVENGYLAFKNEEVFNQVNNEVNAMTKEEYSAWQKSLGFVSATTYYEPIFEESELVNSSSERDAFITKYNGVMKITHDEFGNYDVDYPISMTPWLKLCNKNGVFRVGEIINSYSNEYIAVFDGDYNKLLQAKELISTNNYLAISKIDGLCVSGIQHNSEMEKSSYNPDDYRDKRSVTGWLQYDGDNDRLDARLEYITRFINENDIERDYYVVPYIWLKSQHRRNKWAFWYAQDANYSFLNFCASIVYSTGSDSWNLVSHHIYSGSTSTAPIADRYVQFVFDEYRARYFKDAEGGIPSDAKIVNDVYPLYFYVRFKLQGSHFGWDDHDFDLDYGMNDYNYSYPGYQTGYPEWFNND